MIYLKLADATGEKIHEFTLQVHQSSHINTMIELNIKLEPV